MRRRNRGTGWSVRVAAAAILIGAFAPGSLRAGANVNVNTASEQELLELPEMTVARARAIINYRESTGELIQVEELELIPQVKPIYPKLKGLVVVE
jgi:competence ComEA-like helix-hairpin-helix protein